MPWKTLRGSKVSAALGAVAITWFWPLVKRSPVKTSRIGSPSPPHSREMRSASGVMSLPGTSAACGDPRLQEVEVDGAGHQAKPGHHHEHGQGEDNADRYAHAYPISSLDQGLNFQLLDDGDAPGRACRQIATTYPSRASHVLAFDRSPAATARPRAAGRRVDAMERKGGAARRSHGSGAARCPVRQQPVFDRDSPTEPDFYDRSMASRARCHWRRSRDRARRRARRRARGRTARRGRRPACASSSAAWRSMSPSPTSPGSGRSTR